MKSISSRIASKNSERFAIDHAAIVAGVHLLACGVFFYFSFEAVTLWIASHLFFTIFGISLGHHRLLSHNAFLPGPILRNMLATVATLCFQGGPLFWASAHRMHHARTGKTGDPHSVSRGFIWSHFGWMFYRSPNGFSYVKAQKLIPDLIRSGYLRFLERNSVYINLTVLCVSFLLCLYVERLDIFYWILPFRIVTVWHATWSINSFSHRAHSRNIRIKESTINSHLINILLPGEGFHKNHHDHPSSPTTSFHWYQLDPPYWILVLLSKIGFVQLPNQTEDNPPQVNASN